MKALGDRGQVPGAEAENLLITHSKELAKAYLENWQEHKEHSEQYKR